MTHIKRYISQTNLSQKMVNLTDCLSRRQDVAELSDGRVVTLEYDVVERTIYYTDNAGLFRSESREISNGLAEALRNA